MLEKILVYWVAVTPFLFLLGFYEGTKIYSFEILVVFVTLCLLFKWRERFIKALSFSDAPYFIWLLVLLYSSLKGVHPAESIIGTGYRHQGVLFFLGLWIVYQGLKFLSKKSKENLVRLLAFSAIFEAIFVIIQKYFIASMTLNSRPFGTFGEPNAVAGFLALSGIFVLRDFPRKFKAIAIAILFIAINFTESRTGLVTLFVIVTFYLLRSRNLLLVSFLGIVVYSLVSNIFVLRETSMFENRQLFSVYALEAIDERPFIGYGAESAVKVFERKFKEHEMPLMDLSIDRSHNLFLDILLWSGIIGFISFISWLISLFKKALIEKDVYKRGLQSQKLYKIAGFSGWLLFSMFQPLGVVHWLLLLLILSLI